MVKYVTRRHCSRREVNRTHLFVEDAPECEDDSGEQKLGHHERDDNPLIVVIMRGGDAQGPAQAPEEGDEENDVAGVAQGAAARINNVGDGLKSVVLNRHATCF
jgi:hypothetical protein